MVLLAGLTTRGPLPPGRRGVDLPIGPTIIQEEIDATDIPRQGLTMETPTV